MALCEGNPTVARGPSQTKGLVGSVSMSLNYEDVKRKSLNYDVHQLKDWCTKWLTNYQNRWSVHDLTDHPSHSVNQSLAPSLARSLTHSINRSINQSSKQASNRSIDQSIQTVQSCQYKFDVCFRKWYKCITTNTKAKNIIITIRRDCFQG